MNVGSAVRGGDASDNKSRVGGVIVEPALFGVKEAGKIKVCEKKSPQPERQDPESNRVPYGVSVNWSARKRKTAP